MKKTTVLLIAILFMVIGYAAYNATVNIYGNAKLAENLSDFKVYLSNLKVDNTEVEGINETKDEFTVEDINGNISVDIINDSTEYDTEAYLDCDVDNTWDFDYTGGEQTFTALSTGTYKLEVWGAQGGKSNEGVGGYGGYSQGYIQLEKNSKVFVNVGGAGVETVDRENVALGGYNGGGPAFACGGKFECGTNETNAYVGSGGGATHIASASGVLANLSTNASKILIVAGAGGGNYGTHNGGSGGGISGNSGVGDTIYATGGTQTSGGLDRNGWNGSFGLGSLWLEYVNSKINFTGSGGGSGLYGGGRGFYNSSGAGGGSGYIGNALLSEKAMYCYNCEESSEENTKTISTTCTSVTPTKNCAKQENGYARITLTSSTTNIITDAITIKAQESTNQIINGVVGKSVTCRLKLNKVSRTKKAYSGQKVWTYDYTGGEQVFTAPVNGTYKFELWGAQGGAYYQTATGSYVSGELNTKKDNKFYVYVGRSGLDSSSTDYVFNYGYQNYTKTGGGATDIRLVDGSWDSLSSLVSRIMVAGGGGSQGGLNPTDGGSPYGGAAGGLVGYQGGSCISGNVTEHAGAKGATQTSGHAFGFVSLLNTGGSYFYNNPGGNGYWSGNFYDWVGTGGHPAVSGAGGGSSFISGHAGCVAILSQNSITPRSDSKGATCKDGTSDITCSYHYSNIIFKNTTMIDGNGYSWTTVKGAKTSMPSHDGLSTVVGNIGNGYAKITLISQD